MTTDLLEEIVAGRAPPVVALTVDQFQEMIKSGIIPDGSPVELIDGILVQKDRSAAGEQCRGHNPRHALMIRRLLRVLSARCESLGFHVQSQLPIALTERNAPEPDVAIISGDPEVFGNRHPRPGEIAAVFEIADSSLRFDRSTKQRLYASAGIPTYWIVNLPDRCVEVHRQPDAVQGLYSERTEYRPGDSIALAVGRETLAVDVAALLA